MEQKKQKKEETPQFSRKEKLEAPTFAETEFRKNFWNGNPGEEPPSSELKAERQRLGILVKGCGNLNLCPAPIVSCGNDGLPPEFQIVFNKLSFQTPSLVQMQCWPAILSGANVLCFNK
jgi:superfamily II DNA/RNA helicase